jgi:hypothetical protein
MSDETLSLIVFFGAVAFFVGIVWEIHQAIINRPCRYCQKKISKKAIKCPYCHSDLTKL